jgi:endonuclease YncB( thermonuclease family)
MLGATTRCMIAAAMVTAGLLGIPAPANAAAVDYVVDGDTIRLRSGVYVRLIGIDTPEVGQCGYAAAKRKLDQWVGGDARLVNPSGVDDRDHYGRLIRYVHDSGRDTGLGLIRLGLAKARYDGLDGYDRHPRQATYRRADRNTPDSCR